MKILKTIFREYDIRGVAGKEFDPRVVQEYEKWYGKFPGITITLEAAEALGRGYGTIIRRSGGKRIVVGYEMRPFGKDLKNSFVSGVRKTGCDVTDLGVSLTPLIYFKNAYSNFDGGVSVTGSHNVYFFNGFKLMKKDVYPLYGKELQEMRMIVEEERFFEDKKGGYAVEDGYKDYKHFVQARIKFSRKMRIVIDSGNGSAGLFAPDLFRSLGCEVLELYSEPDTTFPNHVPDPEQPQYMRDLADAVKANGADLGIGFDADGDRVGFVDERGEFVEIDLILLLLARDVLSRHPGKKILFDVKCTQLFEELVPVYGGVPLMHRTGHAPIKAALREDPDIILGGEVSGHIFLVEDFFRFDDGLFAAARVLEFFSHHAAPFSSLFTGFPNRVRTPEIKLPCSDEEKFGVVESIQKKLTARFPTVTIDGVRFRVSETGWGLLRASNTSPYLTIRAEGINDSEVLEIKNILADELEKFPAVADRLDRLHVSSLTGKLGWV